MQNENTTPFQTHPVLGPTLKMLRQQNLEYSIYGEGRFVFAFWLTGEERTHFVLTSDIVEYSRYFNYYLAAQALGECRLMVFKEEPQPAADMVSFSASWDERER